MKKQETNDRQKYSTKNRGASTQQRMDEFFKRHEKHQKELGPYQQDPQVMALPHPLRTLATSYGQPDLFPTGIVGFEHADFVCSCLKEGLSTTSLWTRLDQMGAEQFLDFMRANAGVAAENQNHEGQEHSDLNLTAAAGGGASGAMFQAMRYQQTGGAMFTLDQHLLDLLLLTDIDLDIPITEVKLPFANVYIECGKDRSRIPMDVGLVNPSSGFHAFEGAYISQTRDENGAAILEVTMTGSPQGHTELSDDAVEWVSMKQSEHLTIAQALSDSFSRTLALASPDDAFIRQQQSANQARQNVLGPVIERRLQLILKALLYIDLKDVRTSLIGERALAQKELARAQSGAHRRSALRKMIRARQSILIMAPGADPMDSKASGMQSAEALHAVAAHWRRGHFRRQRHGLAMALSRIIWISPQLVNAQKLGDLAKPPPAKHYQVKT